VDEDDKKKMDELGNLSERLPDPNARKIMFINESGLYSLILRSEKPEATPLDSGLTIKRKWRSGLSKRPLASDGPSGSIFLVSLRPLCSMGGLLGRWVSSAFGLWYERVSGALGFCGKGSLELNGLAMLLVSGVFGLQGCSCVVSLWACLVSSLESY